MINAPVELEVALVVSETVTPGVSIVTIVEAFISTVGAVISNVVPEFISKCPFAEAYLVSIVSFDCEPNQWVLNAYQTWASVFHHRIQQNSAFKYLLL